MTGRLYRGRGGLNKVPLRNGSVRLDPAMKPTLEPEDRLLDEAPRQARHGDADRQVDDRAEQGTAGVEAMAAPQCSEYRLDREPYRNVVEVEAVADSAEVDEKAPPRNPSHSRPTFRITTPMSPKNSRLSGPTIHPPSLRNRNSPQGV